MAEGITGLLAFLFWGGGGVNGLGVLVVLICLRWLAGDVGGAFVVGLSCLGGGEGGWALDYYSMEFRHFPDIS